MAATEVETPVKMCMLVLEKKVRNLEKRKGKLESYQEKLTSGEGLNKDQLSLSKEKKIYTPTDVAGAHILASAEAIQKYDEVLQTLEFSRDLQKQFQSISVEMDKMQKKQSKKEKTERQQTELLRLQELLHLQTLLDALGDDAMRERLKSAPGELFITDENLNQLDEFYQLIAPSREENKTEFTQHVASAAEHIQLYLDRSDRSVVNTTYCALHELVHRLESNNLLHIAANQAFIAEETGPTPAEHHQEAQQQLTLVQQSELPASTGHSEHSDLSSLHLSTGVGIIPVHDSTVVSFSATVSASILETPWASQSISSSAAAHSSPLPVGNSAQVYENSFFGGIPSSSQLPVSHRVESSSYAQHVSHHQQQRPIQDIVSSMQGSFHFLQESQIDLENQALMSNVRSSNQNYAFSAASTMPSGSISQYPGSPSALNHASSPHHFTSAVSSLYHQPAAAAFFGGQHRASPVLSFADPHQGSYLLPEGSRQMTSPSDEACPMPIPLPNEVSHGQSLTMNAYNVSELSKSPVNKQFAMNPNANVFRSVYEPAGAVSIPNSTPQFLQSNDSLEPSVEAGTMPSQNEGDFADADGGFTTVGGYDGRGSGNYARLDNGYSRGGRGSAGQAYTSGRGGSGGGYNTQRGTGVKTSSRGGSSVGASGGMGNSTGQGTYSARGGNSSRGGRGFNQSGRVRQHMAA